jgi:hypothetical protein
MARNKTKDATPAPASPTAAAEMSRTRQFIETYRMTKKSDRWIGLILLGSFLVAAGLGFLLFGVLLPVSGLIGWIVAVTGTLMMGLLVPLIVFGRRAQNAAYRQMEGQPGAAAAALRMLKRGWRTEPAIAFTKQQDILHRVVGPPGIVLIGEGNPHRLRQLMINERRKHERVAAEVPIHEVMVGNGEGEVPLPKLVRHVQKLGRQVKGAELTDVLNRLKALDAQRTNLPIPKGPIPTSMKGMRGNLRGR